MNYFLAFMIGWCGTYWPRRFPGGGGGGWDPSDPWPPNCRICGAIIGGFAAVILEATIGPKVGDTLIENSILWFFAGAAGSSLVEGLLGFTSKRAPVVDR